MKKLIFAAIAIVSFASCVKNEVAVVEDNSPISFQTVVGTPTKAPIEGTAYPTNPQVPFGTIAFNETSDGTYDTNPWVPMSEVQYGTFLSEKWTTAKAYYWPKENQGSLTFYSFSPWNMYNPEGIEETGGNKSANITVSPNTTDGGIKIFNWNVKKNQDKDVMIADAKFDLTGNSNNGNKLSENNTAYNGVPTVFRHKLAQIAEFSFRTYAEYTDYTFKVTKVSINNFAYQGDFSVGYNVSETEKGSWTLDKDENDKLLVANEIWYDASSGEGITIDKHKPSDNNTEAKYTTVNRTTATNDVEYYLVLPQKFESTSEAYIEIVYTVTDNNATGNSPKTITAKKYLKEILKENAVEGEWAMNTKISYKITLSSETDRIIWDPEVVAWAPESFGVEF